MKLVFFGDRIETLEKEVDSTWLLIKEAIARNHEVFYSSEIFSRANWGTCLQPIVLDSAFVEYNTDSSRLSFPETYKYSYQASPIDEFDFCFMRKDPPVDLNYYNQVLLMKQSKKVKILNHPEALLTINEKLSILEFPDLISPTLVTQNIDQVKSFFEEYQDIVIKPLNHMGGKGILRFCSNFLPDWDLLPSFEWLMLQKYIPEIKTQGDKRLILINGDYAGACLRVAPANSFLANLSSGGTSMPYTPSDRDLYICSRLKNFLIQNGIFLAGIDIIGDYLTEINITSPSCMVQANYHSGIKLESMFFDSLDLF